MNRRRGVPHTSSFYCWLPPLALLLLVVITFVGFECLAFRQVVPPRRISVSRPPLLRPLLFATNSDKQRDEDAGDVDDDAVVSSEESKTEEIDVPSWVKAIREWPSVETSSSSTTTNTRPTDEWLLRPLQDHEEAWLDEIVGTAPTAGTSGSSIDVYETTTQSSNNSNSSSSSFLNPLISLINMENMLSEADGQEAMSQNVSASSKELKKIRTPFDLPIGPNMDLSQLEELGGWDQWAQDLRQNVADLTTTNIDDQTSFAKSAEAVLKQATTRIEEIISDASSVVSPVAFQELIGRARGAAVVPSFNSTTSSSSTLSLRDIDAASFATNLVSIADRVLRKGYVTQGKLSADADDDSKALFSDFVTVQELKGYSPYLQSVADMGLLAGSIYEDSTERCHEIGHSICAQGYSSNVLWMVTDTTLPSSAFTDRITGPETGVPVRTIVIRGFDASDEEIDRETLLNDVCAADPVPSSLTSKVLLHGGLLEVAKGIYKDVKKYIEWSAPSQKLALCGHSIGGSLSTLLLLLLTEEYGADFVEKKVLRVFSYGSPPISCLQRESSKLAEGEIACNILTRYGLPTTIVHGFSQPWDPIVRLFTEIDALYPLAEDLGVDGMTPYNDGPPRTLRPITKKIFEAWDGWPRFRETFKGQSNQNYTAIGVLHLVLPEPTRFLTDRFVAVNIQVPQVETLVRISASEHLSALSSLFPLDTFEISFVPQAIRSFVHHFYPAYDEPIASFVKRRMQKAAYPKKTQVVGEKQGETTAAVYDAS